MIVIMTMMMGLIVCIRVIICPGCPCVRAPCSLTDMMMMVMMLVLVMMVGMRCQDCP
uniref:Uncharacterized protein n=1 Tax=Rhizophora mucronata TaxID=61149 RepID=A0A2P2P131_RHIMU